MLAEHREHRRVLNHRCCNGIRVDRVDPDPVLAEFERQGVGHRRQPVLGSGVMAVARGRLESRRRADDDDRAAVARVDHRRDRGPQRPPGAGEVDVDNGVPLLVGELPEPAPAEHPGIGDHNVEPPEPFHAVGDELPQCGIIADVDGPGQHRASLRFHQADGLGQILGRRADVGNGVGHGRADIADDDVGALLGQPNRICAALTARGARHECHSSRQITHYPVLSACSRSG